MQLAKAKRIKTAVKKLQNGCKNVVYDSCKLLKTSYTTFLSCFDGKILIKRVCETVPTKWKSVNSIFVDNQIINKLLTGGQWRELFVDANDLMVHKAIKIISDFMALMMMCMKILYFHFIPIIK